VSHSKVLQSWSFRGLPPLIYGFVRALERTIRWVQVNPGPGTEIWAKGERVILVFWHNRMLMAPFFYGGRGLKILISRHADGELIRRVMVRFHFGSVRGSTQRGGTEAFRELLRSVEEGWDIVVTPDGPRGPRYVVQRGVVELARQTGLPILPVTYSTRHRIHCPSWDGFLIPRPFTRGVFIWGHPLRVARRADPAQREEIRALLERSLRRITQAADEFFACGGPESAG
jgi:lysophospholipid acyltransferase (LPLAT)-like uncharacterized protein